MASFVRYKMASSAEGGRQSTDAGMRADGERNALSGAQCTATPCAGCFFGHRFHFHLPGALSHLVDEAQGKRVLWHIHPMYRRSTNCARGLQGSGGRHSRLRLFYFYEYSNPGSETQPLWKMQTPAQSLRNRNPHRRRLCVSMSVVCYYTAFYVSLFLSFSVPKRCINSFLNDANPVRLVIVNS